MHVSSALGWLGKFPSKQPYLLMMAVLYLLWLEEVLVDAAIRLDHLWGAEDLPHLFDPLRPLLCFRRGNLRAQGSSDMARLIRENAIAVGLQVQGHRVLYNASPASPGLLQDQRQGFQQMPCMLSTFYTITKACE